MLPIVIISDCCDDNARMRLTARAAALIPGAGQVSFCGAKSDLEAAGHLVDALDSLDGHPGLVLLNVAPRNGGAKRWLNGSPFGHLKVGNVSILTTVGGYELSLLCKLSGVPAQVDLFDVSRAVASMGVSPEVAARIVATQFRSYDFLPRVAAAVISGKLVPSAPHTYAVEAPQAVWYVDVFGNIKLTLVLEEVGFEPGRAVSLRIAARRILNVNCFAGLADIPDKTPGLTVGSSGLGEKRFLELQVQGGSAAKLLGLAAGVGVTPLHSGRQEIGMAGGRQRAQA